MPKRDADESGYCIFCNDVSGEKLDEHGGCRFCGRRERFLPMDPAARERAFANLARRGQGR